MALDRQRWRVYVVSLCRRPDTALQWLHYGRSGAGVAIGFKTSHIERVPFRLSQVLYDRARQVEWCRSIVAAVDDALDKVLRTMSGDSERELLGELARDSLATQIWSISPLMKHPAFLGEDEWRLVAHVPSGPGVPEGSKSEGATYFRQVANRIVPYKEIKFETVPVVEIILGASTPIEEDHVALQVLMEETLVQSDDINVTKSPVSVRPS